MIVQVLSLKVMRSTLCLLLGGVLLFLGVQQRHYATLLTQGNRAVAERRFDSLAYERAAELWWASKDILLFNRGVRAFWAQNLQQAMPLFREASQAADRTVRSKALYSSGVIMMAVQQPEHAAALFAQALRLDPSDKDAKFNLEQLYHFVQTGEGGRSEASLDQLPQTSKQAPPDTDEGELGSGKGRQRSGI
jgi:tetratricopeptide (TPR) repeat protein